MEEIKQDVKQTVEATSAETSAKDKVDTTAKVDESKTAIPESRSIPYERFKEKVDEAKELSRKVKQVEALAEQKAQEAVKQTQMFYESEIAKLQRAKQETYGLDETDNTQNVYQEQMSTLNKQIEELKYNVTTLKEKSETEMLRTQIQKLRDVYPSLDEEHVYVVKKMKPDWDLNECAEYSHNHFEGVIKGRYDKMMEEKKKAAQKPVMGGPGKIALKPEERPKTLAEAKKRMLSYVKNFEE